MKIYSIDVNVTKRCSLKCDYCFAHPAEKKKDTAKDFYDWNKLTLFAKKLLSHDFFAPYEILNVNLWGGEPTLRSDMISNIISDLAKYPNVKFFIYSNGYKFPPCLHEPLEMFKNAKVGLHPKLCVQVSYDGRPIHDIYRRSRNRELTSTQVQQNIKYLNNMAMPFVIKSTVTPDTFKYMYDAYNDIKKLAAECIGSSPFKNLDYFPTIDYYVSEDYTEKEMDAFCQDLEQSLAKIAKAELDSPLMGFKFKWFTPNRALCSAGKDMVAVDIDGSIYTCHACMYDDVTKPVGNPHHIAHIEDENVFQKMMSTIFYCSDEHEKEPEECKECPVTYCLRCNHAKFHNSKKETYIEKWTDFTSQPNLCRFYKINNKVRAAYDILRRN